MSAPITKADIAVEAVLLAIRADGRKAYLMGVGTRSFAALTEAHCDRTGENLENFRREFWAECRPEKVVPAESQEAV